MTLTRTSPLRLSLAAVCVAAAAGCGGSSKPSAEEIAACVDHRSFVTQVNVIKRYYREGKLGTAAQIRRDVATLRQRTDNNYIPTQFLRKDGTFPAADALNDDQKATLAHWEVLPRVFKVLDTAPVMASLDGKAQARRDCADGKDRSVVAAD